MADFGPNGGEQGAAAAVGQTDEQEAALYVIGVIEDGQPAAAPPGEIEDQAALEGLPHVQQVEGGILETGMELLGHPVEVLRA